MSKKWETITFDQIRKGDLLKVGQEGGDIVFRGIAHLQTNRAWYTRSSWLLAGQGPRSIQRRVVKAPKPAPLPTNVGDIILVHEIDGLLFDPPVPYQRWITRWESPSDRVRPCDNRLRTDTRRFTKWEHAVVVPSSTVKD